MLHVLRDLRAALQGDAHIRVAHDPGNRFDVHASGTQIGGKRVSQRVAERVCLMNNMEKPTAF